MTARDESAGTQQDLATADSSDLGLRLPLQGLQLIEASAGTGKTYTLATLVTRLVIERGYSVDQILAVTFTEAATQELRERLRLRLQLAARLAAGDLALLARRSDDPEIELTATLVERRLADESAVSLRARLQHAAQSMDLAAVHTIHGFCARVLGDHALDTGRAFVSAEMIGSEQPLREDVAADLWRSLSVDEAQAGILVRRWNDPAGLAKALDALLKSTTLLPVVPIHGDDPTPALREAAMVLRKTLQACGAQARVEVEAAMQAKVLSGVSYKAATLDALWNALERWTVAATDAPFVHEKLELLASARLVGGANKGKQRQVPCSGLFDCVTEYLAAQAAVAVYTEAREIAFVHRVRDLARERMAALKRQRYVQTYDDLIDDVATALEGPSGNSLAQRLREQYAVALVDEFQDTDTRQWQIFNRVFGESSLFLIGDPKQAIYRFRGGDVHSYLVAASRAGQRHSLARNFRSRPSLLHAIGALYAQAGDEVFIEEGIRFEAVAPGGEMKDSDFIRGGMPAPGLTLRILPLSPDKAQWNANESRALAARACVAEIDALLREGRAGSARINGRNLRASDIAILVARHKDAARMQRALAAAGIPSVTASKLGLFQTEEAQELLWLLEALLQPADEGRLRIALASVLLGQDATAIDALDTNELEHRHWQVQFQAWRERWEGYGPLALIDQVCACNAPRLLGLADGERRLTNFLQLAELLQEASTHSLGMHGLVDWLGQQIADTDITDETRELRLESDAQCVQIMTVHKSKGLEFPLVFLPFAGLPRKPGNDKLLAYHRDGERITQMETQGVMAGELAWKDAKTAAVREDEAEAMRLLYVGLTRAQHALWLAWGPLHEAQPHANTPSALGRLLGAAGAMPQSLLDAVAPNTIRIDSSPIVTAMPAPLLTDALIASPPARIAQRMLRRDWWVYSYSLLARDATLIESPTNGVTTNAAFAIGEQRGAEDEPEPAQVMPNEAWADAPRSDSRFAGMRFGNALHFALEKIDFARWHDWGNSFPPPNEEAALLSALRREGYVDVDLADGTRLLCGLIADTVNVRLPEGAQLSALAAVALRSELEFHFAMASVSIDAWLALLHAHGYALARRSFGLRRRIEGLMTGKIDLVYLHDGRFYLLDYKSNRLADYGGAELTEAMHESEYDLQYLIYSLALHRWLRFRLGPMYDYDTHFGGVRYLFCRGLDAKRPDSPGIFATTPPRELIDALDVLFASAASLDNGRRSAS